MPAGTPACVAAAKASRAICRVLPQPSRAYHAPARPLSPARLGGRAVDGVVWASSSSLLSGLGFGTNFIECSSIRCTPGATSRIALPAADAHVHIKGIKFDQTALPTGLLTSNDRRSRSAEGVQDCVSAPAAIGDGSLDQLNRLHRRVQIIQVGFVEQPHIPLVPRAAPVPFGSLP